MRTTAGLSFAPAYRLMLVLTFLLSGFGSARAQDWINDKASWIHSSGIHLTVPESFQASEKDRVLTLSAQNATVSLTFVAAHGKAELDEVVRSVNQTLADNKAVMKGKAHSVVQQDVEIAFKEGDCTLHDVAFDVTIVIMGHDDDFLICQLLMPKSLSKQMDPILTGLFDSIGYSGISKRS